MRKIILILPVLLLAGCATVHQTYAPDGHKAYALNCSGMARGWDKCQEAAGEICRSKGYNILTTSDESTSVESLAASGSRAGWSAGGLGGKTNERSMLVECKP